MRFTRAGDGPVVDTCATGQCPAVNPNVQPDPSATYIPGDGIDQDDQRLLFGGRARYQRYWSVGSVPVQSQVAVETRRDDINVALHRQVRRQRFYTINQLNVEEQSVSGYTSHQVFLTDWLRIEGGLRGDVFFFDGRNRLPAQGTDPNFEAVRIDGNESDGLVSPKFNLILTPVTDTDIYLNFGEGYHSNDARSVLLTGQDGLAQAWPTRSGRARTSSIASTSQRRCSCSIWTASSLSRATAATSTPTAIRSPATSSPAAPRGVGGVDFEARYRFTDWLIGDYDLSYVRTGPSAIPLAPTLLMNGGLTVELDNGFSAALRFRYVDDRPADEERTLVARGYTLVDLLAKYRWRSLEATLALLNLPNTDWREAQFGDPSCVRGEVGSNPACPVAGGGEGVNDINFTPGNPFGVRGGMTVYF